MTDKCIVIQSKKGIGGPNSFLRLFKIYLDNMAIQTRYWPSLAKHSVVLVSPCITNLPYFFWLRLVYSFRYVSRLDGFFHNNSSYSFLLRLRRYYFNVCIYIQAIFSEVIIFQSTYVRKKYCHLFPGKKLVTIYNPFNQYIADTYSSRLSRILSSFANSSIFVLCVEGEVQGTLAQQFIDASQDVLPVHVFGATSFIKTDNCPYYFHGLVEQTQLYSKVFEYAETFQSLPIYLCLEDSAPCPNSVIEALSIGIPVLGPNDGAVGELVEPEAGLTFQTDKNKHVTCSRIIQSLEMIRQNYHMYSSNALKISRKKFSPNDIFASYVNTLHSL